MKFATAFALLSTIPAASAFAGMGNSFAGRTATSNANVVVVPTSYRSSWLSYENSRDNPRSSDPNVWSVLAHTEKWISQTLASTETASGNPYSRKEVNYVCETNEDSPMIAANMFKRLREARELGQRHGVSEEDHMVDQGKSRERRNG